MEIRNNTPSFGMAFIKPDRKTMLVLEKYVEPRSFEAFVKEQAGCKYFDITTSLARGYEREKGEYQVPLFSVVAKEGKDTFGYGTKPSNYHAEGFFKDYRKKLADEYNEELKGIRVDTKFKKFVYNKILTPITSFCYKKDVKNIEKNHPERLVLPALRQAGDKALELDAQVAEASKISKIMDNQ